jgi:hypothetical protein
MSTARFRFLPLVLLALAAGHPLARAQGRLQSAATLPERQYETREQLEARAQAAETQGRTEEAFVLRNRLTHGDFQEGDRIVLDLLSLNPQTRDTIIVRAGKVLQFAGMSDFSLEGILRSELNTKLTTHLAKFLQSPSIRATPLVRLSIGGNVMRPGFYYTSADMILSDVIMLAGGQNAEADLNKITIRRGTSVLWQPAFTRTALAEGVALDRLDLRAGDEIEIGKKSQRGLSQIVPVLSTSLAVLVTLVQLLRR